MSVLLSIISYFDSVNHLFQKCLNCPNNLTSLMIVVVRKRLIFVSHQIDVNVFTRILDLVIDTKLFRLVDKYID